MRSSHPMAVLSLTLTLALMACNDSATTPAATAARAPSADMAASTGGDHSLINGTEIQWGPALPCFPAGAELAVIQGNPFAAGNVWSVRLLLPDGYVIDPHTHPTEEAVTVLSGTLLMGMGSHYDESSMTTYGKDGFATIPADHPHYVKALGRTELQVHGVGPFALIYVEQTHGDLPNCAVPAS